MPNWELEETQIQILRFLCKSVFCVFRDGCIMIINPLYIQRNMTRIDLLICILCPSEKPEWNFRRRSPKRKEHYIGLSVFFLKWASHSSTYFSQSSFGSQLWITSDLLQKLVCFVSLASTGTCCHGQQVWHFNRCFCISGWLQGLQKLQGLANFFSNL